jgi:hypothetical protein
MIKKKISMREELRFCIQYTIDRVDSELIKWHKDTIDRNRIDKYLKKHGIKLKW